MSIVDARQDVMHVLTPGHEMSGLCPPKVILHPLYVCGQTPLRPKWLTMSCMHIAPFKKACLKLA
jgi:hypothetical protein